MIAPPMTEPTPVASFDGLGLSDAVLAAVRAVGYETPSPIQQAAIPPLLEGRDLLGQAQTGTGKTAAFALPLLCRIDLEARRAAVARPDADARARDPGRGGHAEVRPQSQRVPRAAHLRRHRAWTFS